MCWTQVLVTIAASGGFVLSIYNLILYYSENIPRIDVEISSGVLHSSVLGVIGEPMIFLQAANTGRKTVILDSYWFLLPSDKKAYFLRPFKSVDFPYELSPGRSCQVGTEASGFARQLKTEGFDGEVKLIGIFKDQVGKLFKSKPHIFNISEWSRQNDKS
jgi:hypothetical protein